MSFDEAKFKSIHKNLLSANTNSDVTDNFQKAVNILKMGLLMDQSSLALSHSNKTTCAIHHENQKNYRNFVSKNMDNYRKECLKMLPNEFKETNLNDFEITLNEDEFDQYINIPCLDEFLDCKSEKISKENIESLFQVTPQMPNIHSNKRTHENDVRSNAKLSSKFTFRTPLESVVDASKGSKSTSDVCVSSSTKQISNKTNSRVVEARFGIGDEARIKTHSDEVNWTMAKPHETIDKNSQFPQKIIKNDQNSYQPSNKPLFSYDMTKKPEASPQPKSGFITAREEWLRQNLQKNGHNSNQLSNQSSNESSIRSANQSANQPLFSYGTSTKTLGISSSRRSVMSKFVPPISVQSNQAETTGKQSDPDRLQHLDPKMIELIRSEIMVQSSPVDWNEIAGLEYAKATIQEAIIFPILRPDIFTGLRRPPRGILLFGPPGTGKTLIGRCIAAKSQSTFFSISASSLTSKWIGEGEKMVRALFAVASLHQPAVIFIDEIDSLLSSRSDTEHESSRRLKTEFLVQLDGARTSDDERVLIVGATNRPQELDDAARRRLTKRLYIPLPELNARIQILTLLLEKERNQISSEEIAEIGRLTDGFSGADMKTLCHEALMGPIRAIPIDEMPNIQLNDVRWVNFSDFICALKRVRASVSKDDLTQYEKWDSTYGLGASK